MSQMGHELALSHVRAESDLHPITDIRCAARHGHVRPDQFISETLDLLNAMKVTALFTVEAGKPVGVIHVHDLSRAGAA